MPFKNIELRHGSKNDWFSEDDIFSFVYEGTDIRHFV